MLTLYGLVLDVFGTERTLLHVSKVHRSPALSTTPTPALRLMAVVHAKSDVLVCTVDLVDFLNQKKLGDHAARFTLTRGVFIRG